MTFDYVGDDVFRRMFHDDEQSSVPQYTSLTAQEADSIGHCSMHGNNLVTPQPVHDIYKDIPSLPSQSISISVPLPVPAAPLPSQPLPTTCAQYEKVRGKSSQQCRRFPDVLPEDNDRGTTQAGGKHHQMWYFLLTQLNDLTKKSVIVWTGHQRHFRVRDKAMLCHLWSRHNGKKQDVKWDSVCRIMRSTGKNGLMMAVPSEEHRGRNKDGEFGFVIEPAFYLKMTREDLDRKIRLHCENGPLTVGSPIDSSWGYPEGTQLEVIPMMQLDQEGNVIQSSIPDPSYITVLPISPNQFIQPQFESTHSSLNSSSSTTMSIPSSSSPSCYSQTMSISASSSPSTNPSNIPAPSCHFDMSNLDHIDWNQVSITYSNDYYAHHGEFVDYNPDQYDYRYNPY